MSSYRVGIVGLSWITSEPGNPGSLPISRKLSKRTKLPVCFAPLIYLYGG